MRHENKRVLIVDDEAMMRTNIADLLAPRGCKLVEAEGRPTEAALPLCYLKSGQPRRDGAEMNPARDGCGLIWYSPLVPMKPALVREYVDMVKRVCADHHIEPLITLTSLSDLCFDSTVPILFDRQDPEFTRRSKACYLALFEAGRRIGVLPYRFGIDHMNMVVNSAHSSWRLVSRIKQALDPQGILAPGRYCPKTPKLREER
ncbi:MAG TPA: hypothetical protein PLF13_13950 [candidate division Zixibacteria bacterium]|nr:hypothetical protein [candidate division Zixibacteria bacterium]